MSRVMSDRSNIPPPVIPRYRLLKLQGTSVRVHCQQMCTDVTEESVVLPCRSVQESLHGNRSILPWPLRHTVSAPVRLHSSYRSTMLIMMQTGVGWGVVGCADELSSARSERRVLPLPIV
jgi:hypothetical protein